jgi:hypothetical protein
VSPDRVHSAKDLKCLKVRMGIFESELTASKVKNMAGIMIIMSGAVLSIDCAKVVLARAFDTVLCSLYLKSMKRFCKDSTVFAS